MRQTIPLLVIVAICLAAGAIGGIATASSVTGWYTTLQKPSWNPPNAVFGPVWTTLYLMMAVAAWLVWRRRPTAGAAVRNALIWFAAQLVLNSVWSLLFFGLHRPGVAAIEIVVLWVAIVATIRAFARLSRPAAWLLVPYVTWVSFAAVLNFTIWRINA